MGRESEESGERERSELGVRGERESGEQLRGKRVGRGNGSHKDYASSR